MSEVRAFHLPGASAMAVLQQHARAALASWARQWMNDEQRLATLSIDCVGEEDLHWSREFEGMHAANGCMWFHRSARERLDFGQAVFGAELMPRAARADDWIAQIADEAWTARNRAPCEALLGAPKSVPTEKGAGWPVSLSRMGSGAVKIFCEPLGLHAIADAGVWSRVPPAERRATRLPALVPLERAAQRASLHLEVMLGRVELELPKLMDLCQGDVLRLSARLDHPFMVWCEGRPFAHALLGDSAGRKSIQFTGQH